MAKKGRTLIIPVRVSAQEKAVISANAKSIDKSSSDFLRNLGMLSDPTSTKKQKTKKTHNNASINWHLSRIGNNLNQLTYAINKARLMNKVDNELAKEIVRELMFFNIQINNLAEESR